MSEFIFVISKECGSYDDHQVKMIGASKTEIGVSRFIEKVEKLELGSIKDSMFLKCHSGDDVCVDGRFFDPIDDDYSAAYIVKKVFISE